MARFCSGAPCSNKCCLTKLPKGWPHLINRKVFKHACPRSSVQVQQGFGICFDHRPRRWRGIRRHRNGTGLSTGVGAGTGSVGTGTALV